MGILHTISISTPLLVSVSLASLAANKGLNYTPSTQCNDIHRSRFCGDFRDWAPLMAVGPCKPQSLLNGQVNITEKSGIAIAFYRCDKGYFLYGQNARACLYGETWSGGEPKCNSKYLFLYFWLQ